MQSSGQMMNTSAFNPNSVHQSHSIVTVNHAPTTHQHPTHAPPMPAASGPLGYHLHAQATPLHLPQSAMPTVMDAADSPSVGTAHSTTPLFDPRQLSVGNPLEKTYYTTGSAVTTAPAAAGSARFYTTAAATDTSAASATQQHHHQHANTILITNNFATQQQFAATPPAQSALPQRTPPTIASLPNISATGSTHFGNNGSNIRIMTTLPSTLQQNGAAQSHQQHTFSVDKDIQQQHTDMLQLQQQQQQQLYQQQQQHQHQYTTHAPHLSALLPQHFVPQHFAATQTPTSQQHATAALQLQLPPTAQQYFLPAASTDTSVAATANGGTKMLPTLPALTGSTDDGSSNTLGIAQATTAAAAGTNVPPVATAATSSTVVLDRINICINNHYSDSMASSSSSSAASSSIDTAAMATNAHAQQPSPIIPAIHHKAVLDTGGGGLHIDAYASNDSTLVIDEPDSTTTTPHTPPTTPENSTPPPAIANTTTTTTQTSPSSNKEALAATTKTTSAVVGTRHAFAAIAQCIELEDDDDDAVEELIINTKESAGHAQSITQMEQCAAAAETKAALPSTAAATMSTDSLPATAAITTVLTSPTPTPPTPPTPMTATLSFVVGEDVFMRRDDGRFYLGTVIDSELLSASQLQPEERQYLVRFDDKSELWCRVDEMRKLGGGAGANVTGSSNGSTAGQMCVACKRAQQQDVVETCERCGRGYHRNCTSETSPGSGIWWCKRCNKAMKMLPNSNNNSVCRQLPYHVDALKWDEKHRVNEEQIYCYCGKTGQFDNNMLQCCKCQNWFHTQCMQNFEHTLLRGDGFFVFCCTICNDGEEFVRRLQMSWVDLLHLTLYNLSVMKKHHKFHHLMNDIWPFIIEKRCTLPLPKEWVEMSRTDLLKNITAALKEHSERFMCGRECKRDLCYYALRNNGPPILPKIQVRADDVLSDELLMNTLKLTVMPEVIAAENDHQLQTSLKAANLAERGAFKSKCTNDEVEDAKTDVYEFRIEDDEKFTSDDEIPIKHIIEKVRKSKGTPPSEKNSNNMKFKAKKHSPAAAVAYEKIELNDENANDANGSLSNVSSKRSPAKAHSESKQQTPKKERGNTPTKSNSSINAEKQTEQSCKQLSTLAAHAGNSNTGIACMTIDAVAPEKSSRKRKAFTLSKTYKEIAAEAAAKRYDSSRICDSSSDENSSSSRGTSLDVIIPPPKNFLGLNNPFRMVTPKKSGQAATQSAAVSGVQKALNFSRSGTVIKSSIFNTTTLDFSSKLAALKNAGMFPNLSTSNLAKAANQPRTVRTIKRRLSAKDITIGPNQEVRRRRTRRPSSNVEVISTTTIHPIPSNFFPMHAKDLLSTSISSTTTTHTFKQQQQPPPPTNPQLAGSTSSSTASSSPASVTSSVDSQPEILSSKPTHGRRLRQRPQKSSPGNSRRSSISSVSTSSNSSSNVALATLQQAASNNTAATNGSSIMQDLKQSVKEYFGAINRIESGEQFSIRAKRQLTNGQTQYLVEWGDSCTTVTTAAAQSST